jgi:hypothetical protein
MTLRTTPVISSPPSCPYPPILREHENRPHRLRRTQNRPRIFPTTPRKIVPASLAKILRIVCVVCLFRASSSRKIVRAICIVCIVLREIARIVSLFTIGSSQFAGRLLSLFTALKWPVLTPRTQISKEEFSSPVVVGRISLRDFPLRGPLIPSISLSTMSSSRKYPPFSAFC